MGAGHFYRVHQFHLRLCNDCCDLIPTVQTMLQRQILIDYCCKTHVIFCLFLRLLDGAVTENILRNVS